MRKLLFASAFVMCISLVCKAHDKQIQIHPVNQSIGSENHKNPRAPMYLPKVFLEFNILTFDASCIGCPFVLMQDGAVVYATVISENAEGNGGEVVLPDYLAGQYEIQIEYGSIILVGKIEL